MEDFDENIVSGMLEIKVFGLDWVFRGNRRVELDVVIVFFRNFVIKGNKRRGW